MKAKKLLLNDIFTFTRKGKTKIYIRTISNDVKEMNEIVGREILFSRLTKKVFFSTKTIILKPRDTVIKITTTIA